MHHLAPLESRRLLAADLTVSALTSNLPASSEAATFVKLKSTAQVTIKNLGPDALPKTAATCTVTVVLKAADNTEIEVAKNDKVSLASLKANATKLLSLPLKLPANVALGSYTLLARVDTTNTIPEADETNNSFSSAPITVTASGNALFAEYGFADQMTFTQTKHLVENNVISEEGTFLDRNGVAGEYIYTVSAPILGRRQITVTLFKSNNNNGKIWIGTIVKTGAYPSTVNGKTANFSLKSNGGLLLTGGPVSVGNKVYFKLT
jgi:hypothetical protein